MIKDSEGSQEIVGTSLVTCTRNDEDRWQCWNVLTPLFEILSPGPMDIPIEGHLDELLVGGFTLCALRDGEVLCGDGSEEMPEAKVIEGLPD
jgi:hypothetical protein